MAALKVGVLISGRGSNLQALIEAGRDPATNARIVLVLSNKADAGGLARATAAGIPTAVIDRKAYADRAGFDAELDRQLRSAGVELVCLAGFMRILTDGFIAAWHNRMINIHPSLLPAYRGLDTHARALADGVKLAGCTVHYVRPELDTGPIILQAAVPVASDDTPDSLAARVLTAEHRAYPLALRLVATGRVRLDGEKAILDGRDVPAGIMMNPAD
ncbi:phosphoribosylglycinamide formyltransferase [Hypericibacter sp.]|uniref:phosphoribosylglycinamide formyltransferase n=1 Tax=Hypericibacter sp. TaxID=2705401 RepID=UPI003D6D25A6